MSNLAAKRFRLFAIVLGDGGVSPVNNLQKDRLAALVRDEGMLWGNEVAAAYHGQAATDMDAQWAATIYPLLSKYDIDYSRTMDFACGHGRNAKKLKSIGAKDMMLVDVNPDNIRICEETLVLEGGYETLLNNGIDLEGIDSNTFTHIYSFDALVHFDLKIVLGYIGEFARVLKAGGTAFIHHSNFTGNPGGNFQDNPAWRNYMSASIFRHEAIRDGFIILEQKIIDWNFPEIDCITLMKRKA